MLLSRAIDGSGQSVSAQAGVMDWASTTLRRAGV